jgi:NAD(P)-dependent dehydrogenase (short-subunit alcohol dehydrogenase family)
VVADLREVPIELPTLDVPVPKPIFVKTDIASEADIIALVQAAVTNFGGVDILVNNAAAFIYGGITTASAEDWDRVYAINIRGYALTTKYAVLEMRKRGGGAVLNLGSICAIASLVDFVPYSATKAAILQMTRNIAFDEGKYGIRVNAVSPGGILTAGTKAHAESQGKTLQTTIDEICSHTIIKRMGTTEEIAKAVCFLCSDDASYITGVNLMVDGGWAVWTG